MNESWWARYTPHFYLFIIASIYILFEYGKNKKKLLSGIYFLLIIANTLLPLLGNSYYVLSNSLKIHRELKKLKNQEIILDVRGYHGTIYNLKDYGISYQLKEGTTGNTFYYGMVDYQVISDEK